MIRTQAAPGHKVMVHFTETGDVVLHGTADAAGTTFYKLSELVFDCLEHGVLEPADRQLRKAYYTYKAEADGEDEECGALIAYSEFVGFCREVTR